jgi:hypothetical protein
MNSNAPMQQETNQGNSHNTHLVYRWSNAIPMAAELDRSPAPNSTHLHPTPTHLRQGFPYCAQSTENSEEPSTVKTPPWKPRYPHFYSFRQAEELLCRIDFVS